MSANVDFGLYLLKLSSSVPFPYDHATVAVVTP